MWYSYRLIYDFICVIRFFVFVCFLSYLFFFVCFFFFFQAEDGIRDLTVTGVQTCALPIFFGSVVTFAVCVRPPDVIVTSPKVISAACSVMLVAGSVSVTRMDSRPRKVSRSEERRVGKECRSRWWEEHEKKKRAWRGVRDER